MRRCGPGSPTTLRQPPALDQAAGFGFADDAQRGRIHAPESARALEFSVFGSPGAVRIKPGTFSVAAGCSAGGLVTVGNSAAAAASLVGMPAAANTAAEPPKPWPDHAELGGVHADVARPQTHTRHDVEGGAQVEGQVEHRRREAPLGVGGAGHDAPRRQMLQQTRIAGGTGEPVVTERDAGQIQPGFRRVHHAWQSGKGQVTTQNPVRATAAEGGDELADAGHPSTLAHGLSRQRR